MAQPQASGAPNMLGDYRVIAELARGGMATVFLAVRERGGPREVVAIKQIHAHLAHDPDFVAMLVDEASIARQIHHPSVVEIRECVLGQRDGKNYIVMEYAAGESLSILLKHAISRGRRVSHAMAASIAADVAGALHAAHELRGPDGNLLGLVHRDVSPQNVILTYDGLVKLTDFGIAKAVGRLQRTQPGEIKGKLAYMAPEQAFGREVDRRSDVYSLGVVLYELSLGRRLFGGKNDAETVRNVMLHNIVPPRQVDPTYPEALEQIVLNMLTKEPEQRFQTAGAVERALRAYVAGSGEADITARCGAFVLELEADRARAKRDLIDEELRRPPISLPPPSSPAGRDPDEEDTLLVRDGRTRQQTMPARKPERVDAILGTERTLLAPAPSPNTRPSQANPFQPGPPAPQGPAAVQQGSATMQQAAASMQQGGAPRPPGAPGGDDLTATVQSSFSPEVMAQIQRAHSSAPPPRSKTPMDLSAPRPAQAPYTLGAAQPPVSQPPVLTGPPSMQPPSQPQVAAKPASSRRWIVALVLAVACLALASLVVIARMS